MGKKRSRFCFDLSIFSNPTTTLPIFYNVFMFKSRLMWVWEWDRGVLFGAHVVSLRHAINFNDMVTCLNCCE